MARENKTITTTQQSLLSLAFFVSGPSLGLLVMNSKASDLWPMTMTRVVFLEAERWWLNGLVCFVEQKSRYGDMTYVYMWHLSKLQHRQVGYTYAKTSVMFTNWQISGFQASSIYNAPRAVRLIFNAAQAYLSYHWHAFWRFRGFYIVVGVGIRELCFFLFRMVSGAWIYG